MKQMLMSSMDPLRPPKYSTLKQYQQHVNYIQLLLVSFKESFTISFFQCLKFPQLPPTSPKIPTKTFKSWKHLQPVQPRKHPFSLRIWDASVVSCLWGTCRAPPMLDHLEIGEAARGTPRSEKKHKKSDVLGRIFPVLVVCFFEQMEDECEQIFWERWVVVEIFLVGDSLRDEIVMKGWNWRLDLVISCRYLGGSRFLDLEKGVSAVGFWSRKSAKREMEDSNKRHPHSGDISG